MEWAVILQCGEPAACQSFADGFNHTVAILTALFTVFVPTVAAVKIMRLAGEDG